MYCFSFVFSTQADPKLVDEFLLYYNAFMTHLDILELLIILYPAKS